MPIAIRSLRALCSKSGNAGTTGPRQAKPTPLQQALVRRIRFNGPLTVAEYMRECLTHPQHGYYTTRSNVLGARGDFITAPEVSQVFGELLGLWATSVSSVGSSSFRLIELGPGTGKLMSDALRVLKSIGRAPGRVDLVEASPVLRKAQKVALEASGINVHWHDSLESALQASDSAPPVILAQEFLDALPVHVLHGSADGQWRERLVDTDDAGGLRFALAPNATPASTAGGVALTRWGARRPQEGDVAELCLEGIAVVERVAHAVKDSGGAALFIDYACRGGGLLSTGNSLRGFKGHEIVPALHSPGECDLTADVNFAHIGAAVDSLGLPVSLHGPVSQRHLLLSLGAAHRFRQIAVAVTENQTASADEQDAALEALQKNYERLTGLDQMGEIYQTISITRASAPPPDGFKLLTK